MDTIFCQNCGTSNPADAHFCARCGKTLAAPAAAPAGCPRCGVPLRSTSRFCPSCGYDITQAGAASPPAPVRVAPPAAASPPPQPPPPPPAEPAAQHTRLLGESEGATGLQVRWMGGNVQNFPLKTPSMSVGRAPDNDVVINHPAVSSHHLRLEFAAGGVRVVDLNSTNGTQLNGHRIQPNSPQLLPPGDVLRIGDLTGNWVSLVLEGASGEALRNLSLGSLDLSNQTNIIIGRDPSCYLPLNHPTVSFRHAQISKQGQGLVIRDLSSTNGTFVNGQRIAQVPLKSGDQIQIGPFKLSYDAQQQSLAQSMRLGHRIDAIRLGREVANKRMILDDVSLTVNPGEFVALVGGSGAGKSTLMKAMNGYEPANQGNLLLDGDPLYDKLDLYRTQMGYVPQDDIIHQVLPVKRALWYAAKLRLPDARPQEIQSRIMDALKAVDMVEHADKPVRVLSGGQRKRVSIAVELLARPTLFYLDEPTSGLDPGLEKKMMYDLNRLADEGRTVILVTHATANIEQCDHVAFMSYGRLAYYGPPNDALSFFGVRDFADIYLRLSQEVDPAKGKPAPPELQPYYQARQGGGKVYAGVLWADHYMRSPQQQQYVAARQNQLKAGGRPPNAMTPPRRSRDSFVRQSFILARRQFDLVRYDWRTMFILLLMVPFVALMFALVSKAESLVGRPGTAADIDRELKEELAEDGLVKDEKTDYIPLADAQILITMVGLALTQAGTFGAAYEIVKERAIYRRERAVNLKATAYVLSKMLILSIFAVIQVTGALLVLATVVDMGFKGALLHSGFIEIYITLYLAMVASIAFGLFISAIVPTQDVVLYVILVQIFIQIILTGTLFPLGENVGSYTVPSYWAVSSLGSTIDLEKLNNEARACKVVEIPSMTGGKPTLEAQCTSAERDLTVTYDHTEEYILTTWIGLIAHIFLWVIVTIFIQARKKAE